MDIHFDFEPDPRRARHLDRRMHVELGRSLQELCDASREAVAFDEAAMERLIESLRDGTRYSPLLFARYYQLARALFEDDLSTAGDLFERLLRVEQRPNSQQVSPLPPPDESEKGAVYHGLMTAESDGDMTLRPPSPRVAETFEDRYVRSMELLERAIPKLAGEVRAIVHDVISVVGDPEDEAAFDGGSHFQLWGALFLNAERHSTLYELVEAVAHESAHTLLFGFCTDEPLVYNDDDERYPSPLRSDPRPMDGIYHATFVSARMHWAMSRLLEADVLSEEQELEAEQTREQDRRNFLGGYEVVAEHGDLSDVGARLIEGAHTYVERVSA